MAKRIVAPKASDGQGKVDPSELHLITYEHPEPKYYWRTPNLIDDIKMSLQAFRLYSHLKRVAGEDGLCWQSQRTLAKKCFMSVGSVVNAKEELIRLHLIKLNQVKNPAGGKYYHHIEITNIWRTNIDAYTKENQVDTNSSPEAVGLQEKEIARSPHDLVTPPEEIARSPHDLTRSPGDINNNPDKNNPIKERDSIENDSKSIEFYEENIGPLTPPKAKELLRLDKQYSEVKVVEALQKANEHDAVVHKIPYAREILTNQANQPNGENKGNGRQHTQGRNNGKKPQKADIHATEEGRKGYTDDSQDLAPMDWDPSPAELGTTQNPAVIQARLEWNKLQIVAANKGLDDLALKHQPPADADWKDIDACTAQLRDELRKVQP